MRICKSPPIMLRVSCLQGALAPTGLSMVSEGERARAEDISHDGERERFLASRALLRQALSEACGGGISPRSWAFETAGGGKVAVAAGLPRIEFSLSHACDCVAVAVSAGDAAPVGVDVEGLWRDERRAIVPDALTRSERVLLDGMASDDAWHAFIRIWTLKEACAKALGLGAALDFTRLEVVPEPECAVRPGGLLPDGAEFGIFSRRVLVAGRPYQLSAAAIVAAPERATFRLAEQCG